MTCWSVRSMFAAVSSLMEALASVCCCNSPCQPCCNDTLRPSINATVYPMCTATNCPMVMITCCALGLMLFLLQFPHQQSKHPQPFTHTIITRSCRIPWSCRNSLTQLSCNRGMLPSHEWLCPFYKPLLSSSGNCDMQRVSWPVPGGAAACDLHVL